MDSVFWPIIRKCLDPDPTRRFVSFNELRTATETAMQADGRRAPSFIINEDRTSAADLVNRGASLKALGFVDEAIRCYDQAISLDPNDPIALVNKGNALSALRANDAVVAYSAALKIDPHCDAAWFNLGMIQQKQGQHENAICSFDSLLRSSPLYALATSNKGNSHAECGRLDEALSCYELAIEIDPRDAQIWTDRGDTFGRAKKIQDALECLRQPSN